MFELVRWWGGLDGRRRASALTVVLGSMGLVVVAEVTGEPWPFVLATVLTFPFGLAASVALYPAWAIARMIVDVGTNTSGTDNDRLTQIVATPINMVIFGAAAFSSLRLLENVMVRRLRRRERTDSTTAHRLPD